LSRHGNRSDFTIGDLLLLAAGAGLGLVAGYFAAERVGRVNTRRVTSAIDRWKERRRTEREPWTAEAAERLEHRVLDALRRDVVLGRRPVRVAILEGGIVELTGRVAHGSEVDLAGDVVRAVDGARTVLNHLLVAEAGSRPVPGPSRPAAARG
jgi:BON domain-containing protein